jgi:hypothetical protein
MAWFLTQALGIEQYDAPNNRTLYRTRVYLNWNNADRYAGYSTSGGGAVDGQGFSFTGPTSGGSTAQNGSQEVYTGVFWVGGDANGFRGTIGASSWFQGSGGFSPGYISASASAPGFDYDRKPGAPSSVTASRSGTSYTVFSGSVSSPAGTPTYFVQLSQNGGAFTSQNTMTNQQFTYTGLAKGSTYVFRCWATNSDGTGPFTNSTSFYVPTEPLAPASLTVSAPSGRSVTVTAGTAPNGGAAITGYFVQFSTNNGSTWSTAQAMTNQQFTYTNLDGGISYLFRAYAVNEMGNGTPATSTSVFVPSGGKRWDGTDFVPTNVSRRWDGSSWINLTTTKRWDGAEWVNLA